MIQLPIPSVQPDSLRVPVPDVLERWRDLYVEGAAQKLLLFALVALLLYLLAHLARRQLGRNIDDVNRRHILRKWIGYLYAGFLLAFGIALFADFLAGLGTMVAVLVAGVAVALQDVLKSFVGWLYISSRSGIDVGSRIEIGGVWGDVIDIGVLKTTMLEIGTELHGMQSTGRLVTVPNYRMLTENVLLSGAVNPFIWHEVRVGVSYESDWRRVEEILREIGEELHAEIAPELQAGFRGLERRFAFKYGTLTPIVYVSLAPSGVDLTLRFLVQIRRRRGSEDRLSRRLLTAFEAERGVQIAYSAHRVYRAGEEHPGKPWPGEGHADPHHAKGAEEGRPPPDIVTG